MEPFINSTADLVIAAGLSFLARVHNARNRLIRILGGLRKLRGSLRVLLRRWLWRSGQPLEGYRRRRGAVPYNRTPSHVEEQIVRLHADQPHLGAGQLARLAERVHGVTLVRETFRKILIRRRDLAGVLLGERRKKPRRIAVERPFQIWGIDHTLLMVLGFFPVWLLGVVDYRGSRLIALERCRPTAAAVSRVLGRVFAEQGTPERLLSDNGPAFRALDLALFLATQGVDHSFTRPNHPWTNGRIERVFRTFKETIFRNLWLFVSVRQIDRYCGDFMMFYNRDRPHSSYNGRTPNEVFFGLKRKARSRGRVSFFDGQLNWYRLG